LAKHAYEHFDNQVTSSFT